VAKEFITGIWLAKFDNAAQLRQYVEYDYLENEDNPKCKFADDIGLSHIDTDFLESVFVSSASEILNTVTKLSFAENFKTELLTSMNLINYADKNSIISVSGIRDSGTVNIKMFDFTPTQNIKGHLLFVGLYKFEE
jgi:hypothetical protein